MTRRVCDLCGQVPDFRYRIERDGYPARLTVCRDCLRRGDRINLGGGQWTTYQYQGREGLR